MSSRCFLIILFFATCVFSDPKLELVQVITRHGDRTPLKPIDIYPTEWSCSLTHLISTSEKGPESSYDLDRVFHKVYGGQNKLSGNCALGQLTSLGYDNVRSIGHSFRQKYVTAMNFLDPTFSADQIYIRSTDIQRTFSTAQAFLEGMYPPNSAFTSSLPGIAIHTTNNETMSMGISGNCPGLEEYVLLKIHKNLQVIAQLLEILKPVATQLQDIFGTWDPLITINYVDDINCRKAHNKTIPTGLTEKVWNLMLEAKLYLGMVVMNETYSYYIGNFVKQLHDQIFDHINGNSNYKFMLFSGHDDTIMPMLRAFDYPISEWPSYASHIVFHLLKDDDNKYFVKLFFQDKPITPNVWGCNEGTCSWEAFSNLVLSRIWPMPDLYNDMCKIHIPG